MKSRKHDDIYIDCQPVNSKGSTPIDFDIIQSGIEDINNIKKSGDSINFKNISSNPLFQLVIGGIGIYALVKISQKVFSSFEKTK